MGYENITTTMQEWRLLPSSRAKAWPDFIPVTIVQDYEEACAIETQSPKASATLARRCIQQILRDFFEVKPGRLYDELAELKGKVSDPIWEAVDALRDVGNIGAHPEKDINVIIDVEPEEAAALINLIDLLIQETYIARDRQQRTLAAVKVIADEKKALKTASASSAALPPGKP